MTGAIFNSFPRFEAPLKFVDRETFVAVAPHRGDTLSRR